MLNHPPSRKVSDEEESSSSLFAILPYPRKQGTPLTHIDPSTPGNRGMSVRVLRIASSGPTDTPEVPAFSRRYVDGGDVIGMHSVIP